MQMSLATHVAKTTLHLVTIDRNDVGPGMHRIEDIEVSRNDWVRWTRADKFDWKVEFNKNGTPFENGQTLFTPASPEASIATDCIPGIYEYTLTVNGVSRDPAIIVR